MTLASTAFALLLLAAPAPAPVAGVSPVPGVRMDTSGPPPAPLADPRVPQPSAASVWIDGHWQWAAGRWSWVAGQWATPPGRPPYVWVAARWVGDDRGFTFHEPFWRPSSSSPAAIHVPPFVPLTASPATPPPLLVESPAGPPLPRRHLDPRILDLDREAIRLGVGLLVGALPRSLLDRGTLEAIR